MAYYGSRLVQTGCVGPKRPALERWREGYAIVGDCWVWQRAKDSKGYGRFKREEGRNTSAHRIGYDLAKGPVPPRLVIDHLCRNRACCNPDHLEAVTNAVNTRRGLKSALRTPPTHCRNGHLYTSQTERFDRLGRRSCRECARANDRRYYAERRMAVQP